MEPAEPAGGARRAGLWRGVPSARVCGGSSKESVPIPHPEGRREAPERDVHACPCQPTGWQRFSPISVAGEVSWELGELTLHSPLAEIRCRRLTPGARGDYVSRRAARSAPCPPRGAEGARPRPSGRPCGVSVPLCAAGPALLGGRWALGPVVASQRFTCVTHTGLWTGSSPAGSKAASEPLARRGPVTAAPLPAAFRSASCRLLLGAGSWPVLPARWARGSLWSRRGFGLPGVPRRCPEPGQIPGSCPRFALDSWETSPGSPGACCQLRSHQRNTDPDISVRLII